MVKKEIDVAVESKINPELKSMQKQMRKMTAFIVKSQKDKAD